MGSKKPSRPSSAPDQAPARDTPPLELMDYPPGRKKKLPGGAYNPYERPIPTGDTARVKQPRTDLRQLSAWIKIKKEVVAQREEEPRTARKPRTP